MRTPIPPDYPTPVKIGAGLMYERLRGQNVLTVEAVEAALDDVFRLWESHGMFGCQCERETISEFTAPMVHILRDSATTIDRGTESLS